MQSATPAPTGCTARSAVHVRGHTAPLDLTIETTAVTQAADLPDPEIQIRVTGRLDRTPLRIKAASLIVGRFLDVEAHLTLRRQTNP